MQQPEHFDALSELTDHELDHHTTDDELELAIEVERRVKGGAAARPATPSC